MALVQFRFSDSGRASLSHPSRQTPRASRPKGRKHSIQGIAGDRRAHWSILSDSTGYLVLTPYDYRDLSLAWSVQGQSVDPASAFVLR